MTKRVEQRQGILYIVATPIGNMGDITLRAIETLKSVDVVACEDTRVTGLLLHRLEIKKPLKALHQHSLDSSIDEIIRLLASGQNIAYVTDGGTPGISDPGQRLISIIRNHNLVIARKNDEAIYHEGIAAPSHKGEWLAMTNAALEPIQIIPIPGASALTAAVSVSGMVEKEFYFAGFLPKKKGRQTEFKCLAAITVPIVIYESALRLEKTLQDIKEYFGEDSEVFIAREMTKMYEEYWGGKIDDVLAGFQNHKLKGEIVLIVRGTKSREKERSKEHISKY